VQKILIVGCGDVARRLLTRLVPRHRVFAVLRDPARADTWRAAGALPVIADLDDRASLVRLAGLADCVVHLAPPPGEGCADLRTRNLIAALGRGRSLPRRLVYVGTTGVYGDCAGARIDETRRLNATNARAVRRVDAERRLRAWGRRSGVAVTILRAPGIYAADRLPLTRLQNATPALLDRDDGHSNHIHADDLAAACLAALRHGRPNRTCNVVDDSELRMGEYFDLVADAFALPRPPRISRAEAERTLSPLQLSFMRESRRIGNRRLKEELKLRLAFPTVADGVRAALARKQT
jgi:nucleoside-diphosphate-sugar epimerase